MNNLEKKIGYTFKNKGLLKTALTHSSYSNEHRSGTVLCNERLEFLGDSILSLMVSRFIYSSYTLPEGELTKMRASVVCEQSLHECARKIGLGEHLFLGKGEESSHGRERPSILADAFEALIAALYLDGGMEEAERIIMPLLDDNIKRAASGKINRDYKTILQEIVQKNKEEVLSYVLIEESGPDHNKSFTVEVHLNSNVMATGKGRSKKEAEQAAAREALLLMGEE